jgi:hypothetical protein
MKREDASIVIRAILIGLFSIAVLTASAMLVAFVIHARHVCAELEP